MTYDVPKRVRESACTPIVDLDRYRETRAKALADPDGFWLKITKERLRWQTPPTEGLRGSFHDIADGPLSFLATAG